MTTDIVVIKNIKAIKSLSVEFSFSDRGILVVTGKNGIGKTSLVKAFSLLSDPLVFIKSSGEKSINEKSYISIS
ncbi:TPA: AAA family ATPase, partial [Aeromonas hydrophila]|nr:AAA family ATPase [Aeromonas hydrophila]